jgi:succinate dehydrogenase/fumarate reductase iron-sulfur protein
MFAQKNKNNNGSKMEKGVCKVRIFRYDPSKDERPRYETYEVPYILERGSDGREIPMRIMAVLDYIRNELGVDIAYRATCGIGRCGTCGVLVNGEPKLACWDKAEKEMTIEPLPNLPIIRDLVVDRKPLEEQLKKVKPWIKRKKPYLKFPEEFTPEEIPMLNDVFKLGRCLECGLCYAVCPLIEKSSFVGPETITHLAKFTFDPRDGQEDRQTTAFSNVYYCTTCKRCSEVCPVEIDPLNTNINLRSLLVERGNVPSTIRNALEGIFKYGNPWGMSRSKRSEWTKNLVVKYASQVEKNELLYFVGCAASYDPRAQNVAKAIVTNLNALGIGFTILGNEENCCGNEVYSLGEKGLFEILVEKNLNTFRKYGVDKIITTSPHCFNAFRNRYGNHGLTVLHYTQFFADLVNKGKLKFQKRIEKRVTYQDPCFLARYNNIIDEPRKIIESIPGVTFLELKTSGKQGVCCGGGGGRMWYEIPEGKSRLAEDRVKEAVEIGANILAVACPFCLLTLDDAVKTTGNEDAIQVKDIMELVTDAL